MRITGVQFSIQERDFKKGGYAEHVESFYRNTEPGDIIVFPEDIGLISAFSGSKVESIAEAMKLFYERSPEDFAELLGKYPGTSAQAIMFLTLTDVFVRDFYDLFSSMSEKYGVYTVACNNMADFNPSEGKYVPADGRMYNSAFVFDVEGSLLFRQRKVFLTGMEIDLGISGGSIDDVSAFKIGGRRFGIAISLDAFTPQYVNRIAESEIILQPDANPGKWNTHLENGRWQPEEWMDSSYYLAQRLPAVEYVVNPMMVGNLMELRFEGESNITRKGRSDDDKIAFIGNQPVTGFHSIIAPEGYQSSVFYQRDTVTDTDLVFKEGTVSVDL